MTKPSLCSLTVLWLYLNMVSQSISAISCFQVSLDYFCQTWLTNTPNILYRSPVSLVHSYTCSETQLRCHFHQETLFNPQAHIGAPTLLSLQPGRSPSQQSSFNIAKCLFTCLILLPPNRKFLRMKLLFILLYP